VIFPLLTIVVLQHRPQVTKEINVNTVSLNFVELSSHLNIFLIFQNFLSRDELLDILYLRLRGRSDDCPELVAIVRVILTQVEAIILDPVRVRVRAVRQK